MVARAESLDGVPVLPEDFDKDPYLLNVANGTLDLRNGALLPHRRGDLISKIANVPYEPDAECPRWLAFLSRIFKGHDELISFVQRAVGYSLTGITTERCLFINHGEGANGKSTLMSVIDAMLGDYSKRMWTETLMQKRQSGAVPNDVAALKGARFLWTSETEEDGKLAEGLVKDLTGGDIMTARYLHQEFFSFKPEGKVWLSTNHKPQIRGTDRAIWDRIRLVPFDEVIPEAERDQHLLEKLRAELPGILAWSVKGGLDWQEHGLGTPHHVRSATEAYKAEMDVLAPFIEDQCELGVGYRVTVGDLKRAYETWCRNQHEDPLPWKLVTQRLKDRGLLPKGGRARSWEGIKLKIPEVDSGLPFLGDDG